MGSMWGEWLAYVQHMAKEDVLTPLRFFSWFGRGGQVLGVSQGLVGAPRGLGVTVTGVAYEGREGEGRGG